MPTIDTWLLIADKDTSVAMDIEAVKAIRFMEAEINHCKDVRDSLLSVVKDYEDALESSRSEIEFHELRNENRDKEVSKQNELNIILEDENVDLKKQVKKGKVWLWIVGGFAVVVEAVTLYVTLK
jgi:hypothetical protein